MATAEKAPPGTDWCDDEWEDGRRPFQSEPRETVAGVQVNHYGEVRHDGSISNRDVVVDLTYCSPGRYPMVALTPDEVRELVSVLLAQADVADALTVEVDR